ncbi:MAG: RNA polymerase sigma factor [Acidobacteriota bacterium]
MSDSDMSTWQAAYDSHGRTVFAYLVSRVGRDRAEDLLQETFVRAIRASSLADPSKVRSYLLSTAHNLLVSQARKHSPLPFADLGADQERVELEREADGTTDARVQLTELSERLEKALEDMSEDHRLAFELAVLQQVTYDEIAAQTGWSRSLVKVNVHRARKKAIKHLADYRPTAASNR